MLRAVLLRVAPPALPRSAARIGALLVAGLLAACASTEDKTAGWSTARIHAEAKEEMSGGAWDKAIPLLEKLEGRAAGTALAQQAQIDKAYAQYKTGDKAQALATLERFAKLHPSSPALDYALYLKGLVNFNDNLGLFASISRQDLSERDQKAAKDSFEAFSELVARFPDSRYAQDARLRLRYIVNSLAQYEVHVARYYYRRGAYVAAIGRAQTALSDYPGAAAQEDALQLLIACYDALGMTQLRDDARRVLERSYPNSAYLHGAGEPKAKASDDPWWKFW